MGKKKSTFIVYAEYIPFLGMYYFLRAIPLKVAYRLSETLLRLFFFIGGKQRKRTLAHIAYSEIETDPAKIKALARKVYASFARLLVEIIKSDQCYELSKISVVGDPDGVDLMSGPNRQALIIVTAHYGNWEIIGRVITAVNGSDIYSIFRPFDNPKIGKIILDKRTGDRHFPVDKQGGMRTCLRALKTGNLVALLVDQHAGPDGLNINFFGKEASTHTAPALLHLRTGVPITPFLVRRKSDNFDFDLIMAKPIRYTPTENREEDVRNITIMYTNALEDMIRQQPDQWLWMHRRWNKINR